MVVSNHIISGKTKFIAHIGFPTDTFTAPKILNPCFKLLNEDLIVIPMACKKENLKKLIEGLKNLENFFGALITMPHKQAILSHLNFKSSLVKQSASCNILKLNKSRETIGEIFDGVGVFKAMCEKNVLPRNKSILLIGAGGVGSGVAFYLVSKGASKLAIFDLDLSRSSELCSKIRHIFPNSEVDVWDSKEAGWDILINATPLGMDRADNLPVAMRFINSVDVVIDLVLSTTDTYLIETAKKNGSTIVTGVEILMAQIPEMLDFFGLEKMSVKEIRTICGF